MKIRLAAEDDLPALEQLFNERAALIAQGDRGFRPDRVVWLGRDSGAVWVGEVDGIVCGYVSVWWTGGPWAIDHMALDAHAYHPGLARALTARVCAHAAERGAARILVRVPLNHPVEQAYWRALGATRADLRAPAGSEWMQFRL